MGLWEAAEPRLGELGAWGPAGPKRAKPKMPWDATDTHAAGQQLEPPAPRVWPGVTTKPLDDARTCLYAGV